MNAMSKLYSLFVKHLRTLQSGEKMIAGALHAFGESTASPQLRAFFRLKESEKENVLNFHREIFRQLHVNGEGESDPVIDSVINSREKESDPERHAIMTAALLYGDDMHIYYVNAYKSAISCAEDLALFDVAELLQRCLDSTVFTRADFEFLRMQSEKTEVRTKQVEAA